MQTKANLRYLRQSPRKVMLVADSVRGADVLVAQNQLKFANRRSAESILKLLNSAVANAENNLQLKKDNLYIKEIKVDEAPTLKRFRPRAFGRGAAIMKRSSHVNIILAEKIETKQDAKKQDKKEPAKVDTRVVKSLKDVSKVETKLTPTDKKDQDKEKNLNKKEQKDRKSEPVDAAMMGKDRNKQHLDGVKQKEDQKGWKSKIFRRKAS